MKQPDFWARELHCTVGSAVVDQQRVWGVETQTREENYRRIRALAGFLSRDGKAIVVFQRIEPPEDNARGVVTMFLNGEECQ